VKIENDIANVVLAAALATRVRPFAAAAIRSLPPVRGRGRLALAVNAAFSRLASSRAPLQISGPGTRC
jgi:hypothetical protein